MTHEDASNAVPLLVIDAVEPSTRAELLAHLAECQDCRQTLADFQTTADALGQLVPQVAPRPELRGRVLAAVVGTAEPGTAPAALGGPLGLTAEPPAAAVMPRTSWAPWLATAAALLAAVSAIGFWQTRGQLAEMRTTLVVWQARVAEAERSAQDSQAQLVAYRRQLDVISADDLLFVSMEGVPPAAAAQARAFVSRSRGELVFSARNLPALPAAQVYQLWAIAGGQPISAGTFVPDPNGRTELIAQVPTLTQRPSALAVTAEPAGGVPAPTGPQILLGAPAER